MLCYPIFQPLLKPVLTFGMPKDIFLVLAAATVTAIFGLGQIWFIGVSIIAAGICIFITKEDPYFLNIYFEFIKLPEVLD